VECDHALRALKASGTVPGRQTIRHGDMEYVDLRGLAIRDSLNRVEGAFLDLSYCLVDDGQIVDVTLANCLFVESDITTNLWGQLESCDFTKARLKEVKIWGGNYVRCTFIGVNLYGAHVSGSSFEDCSFLDSDLRWAHMMNSQFKQCTFTGARFGSGSLYGSTFDNCDIADVDLRDTILTRTVFG
jgi:uncharacterized protein YjbI with pentapeptide repeats